MCRQRNSKNTNLNTLNLNMLTSQDKMNKWVSSPKARLSTMLLISDTLLTFVGICDIYWCKKFVYYMKVQNCQADGNDSRGSC